MAAPAGGFRCFLPALLSAVIFLAALAAASRGALPSRVDFRWLLSSQMALAVSPAFGM